MSISPSSESYSRLYCLHAVRSKGDLTKTSPKSCLSLTFEGQFDNRALQALHRRLLRSDDYVPYALHGSGATALCSCPNFLSDCEEFIPAFYVDRLLEQDPNASDYDPPEQACGYSSWDSSCSSSNATCCSAAHTLRQTTNTKASSTSQRSA